jgi:hypothetical protein
MINHIPDPDGQWGEDKRENIGIGVVEDRGIVKASPSVRIPRHLFATIDAGQISMSRKRRMMELVHDERDPNWSP